MDLVKVLASFSNGLAPGQIGNVSKGAESGRDGASTDEFGVGGVGDIPLVTKLSTAKNLVKMETIKCSSVFARCRRGRWGNWC